jgi:hypothetical protein
MENEKEGKRGRRNDKKSEEMEGNKKGKRVKSN